MGYTHYWNRPEKLDKEKYKRFQNQVKLIIEETDVEIGGYDGEEGSAPEFTEDTISFNGVGDDAHETFRMDREEKLQDWRKDEEDVFGFTKTARKPYDEVVVACLIAFDNIFKEDGGKWSSDGGEDDYIEGRELYFKTIRDNNIEELLK